MLKEEFSRNQFKRHLKACRFSAWFVKVIDMGKSLPIVLNIYLQNYAD